MHCARIRSELLQIRVKKKCTHTNTRWRDISHCTQRNRREKQRKVFTNTYIRRAADTKGVKNYFSLFSNRCSTSEPYCRTAVCPRIRRLRARALPFRCSSRIPNRSCFDGAEKMCTHTLTRTH